MTQDAVTQDAVTQDRAAEDSGTHDLGAPAGRPPHTGHQVIDAALAEVGDLSGLAPDQAHERLAALVDVLAGVLDTSRGPAQSPIPGLRPGQAR